MKAICDFCKRKAKYECPDCATKFCQKHAEEFDYECSACPPPELEKYEDWIDQMLMKGKYTNTDYGQIASPAEWTKYNVLLSLVLNLYQDKYGKEKDYHENKPEIDSVIREAVAMTRFYTSQEHSQ